VHAFPTDEGVSVFVHDVQERHRRETSGRLLAAMGELLAAQPGTEEMVQRIPPLAVESMAEWSSMRVAVPGAQATWGVAHADPSRTEALAALLQRASYAPAGEDPVAVSLRTGEATIVEESEEVLSGAFPDPEDRAAIREMGCASAIVAPLHARGRTMGAITLARGPSAPAFDEGDLALAREIARRAALCADNARLYDEARAAARAREEVLAVVSHDLRNPLNAVLLASTILEEYTPEGRLGDAERLQVRTIRNSAGQMASLIHDLVEVVALESGARTLHLERVDTGATLRSAAEMYRGLAAETGVALEVEAAPVPDVNADGARVLQVLSNLLGNALKFTPAGGTVTVGAEPADDGVRFRVSDSGPGIAPADVPRLFERFWQAERGDRKGLGLGLTIAKGIVDAHGGRIWVESCLGAGSTFFFTLPVHAAT
jgi:signal transduction histidine kinase